MSTLPTTRPYPRHGLSATWWRWRQSVRWLLIPAFTLCVVLPFAIVIEGEEGYVAAGFLAYLNLLLCTLAVVRLARRGTPGALIPLLYLAYFAVSVPLASLYFIVFSPDSVNVKIGTTYHVLDGALRMQLIATAFLIPFMLGLAICGMFKPTVTRDPHSSPVAARFAKAVAIIAFAVISLHIAVRIAPLPSVVTYLGNGSYNYLAGTFVVIGALWSCYARWQKWTIIVLLAGIGLFYTLGNSRGYAMYPIMYALLGGFVLGAVRDRLKLVGLNIGALFFAVYLVIGNTTRFVLGSKGGYQNLGERLGALTQADEVLRSTSVVGSTFGRMFPWGAHSMITRTPEVFPYLEPGFFGYVKEIIVAAFVPGTIYYFRPHSDPTVLIRYGYPIHEGHAVPLTTMGSLWVIGGWGPVLLGAAVAGLLFGIMGRWLDRVARVNTLAALLAVGVLASFYKQAPAVSLPGLAQSAVRGAVAAWFVWFFVVRPIVYRRQYMMGQ